MDGQEVPAKVPSGYETGVKLTAPEGFEIAENVTTTIVMDFDAEASLHLAPGQGWMLTPVVQIVEKAIVLAVTAPAPNAIIRPEIRVEGTVASREPLATLTVNGVAARVSDSHWHADLDLSEGPATVDVVGTDSAGRSAAVQFAVTVDGEAAVNNDLVAANGTMDELGYDYELEDDGSASYLGGHDIAPGCVAAAAITYEEALRLVLCMLRFSKPLHYVNGVKPDLAAIRVTDVHLEADGNTFITAWQMFGDIPVDGTDHKVVVFDFLGMTHYWGPSHRGHMIVQRRTSKVSYRRSLRAIWEWCRRYRHLPLRVQHRQLQQKLVGHYRYFGVVTGNMRQLGRFAYARQKSRSTFQSRVGDCPQRNAGSVG